MSEEEKKEMYKEAYGELKENELYEEAPNESEPEIQTQTEMTKSFNLYKISSTIFRNAESRSCMDYRRFWRLSSEEYLVIRRIDKEEEGYYWEGGWVLMNLSKQQYVKSTVASSILPLMDATDAGCFGQLILSRICWSTDDSCAMHSEGPLHRGPWAGDRFRIVTLDVFERRTSGEEWKDVSMEAPEWLEKLLSDNDQ
jgi:hypothetical protein